MLGLVIRGLADVLLRLRNHILERAILSPLPTAAQRLTGEHSDEKIILNERYKRGALETV
jgi:hypothetical protein